MFALSTHVKYKHSTYFQNIKLLQHFKLGTFHL